MKTKRYMLRFRKKEKEICTPTKDKKESLVFCDKHRKK